VETLEVIYGLLKSPKIQNQENLKRRVLASWKKPQTNLELLSLQQKPRSSLGQILPHISSSKIQLQFAKAKEADGR